MVCKVILCFKYCHCIIHIYGAISKVWMLCDSLFPCRSSESEQNLNAFLKLKGLFFPLSIIIIYTNSAKTIQLHFVHKFCWKCCALMTLCLYQRIFLSFYISFFLFLRKLQNIRNFVYVIFVVVKINYKLCE